jgi:hypothetical protein
VKISQDIALGSLFVAVGLTALLIALNYPMGTAGRMGPGYFPVIVSTLLSLTGAAILLRARLGSSGAIGTARWTPLAVVTVAIMLFGLTIERLGLPLAVLLLCVVAATASVRFRLSWKAAAGAVAFSVLCGILFVKMLGVQIPLVGTWLQVFGAF